MAADISQNPMRRESIAADYLISNRKFVAFTIQSVLASALHCPRRVADSQWPQTTIRSNRHVRDKGAHMRSIILALSLTAGLATSSLAQTTQESTVEVLPDSAVAPPVAPGSTAPTSGSIVLHFRYPQPNGTATGAYSPGAVISALYLTPLAGCITNVEISHRASNQIYPVKASFPSSLMLTFPFAGLLVDGPWAATVTFWDNCAAPAYDVTVTWTLPAQTEPPRPDAVVQGFKLDGNGNRFGNATIYVDGNSIGSSNPYGAGMSPDASHQISSSVPAGYSVAYSACVGCIDHPASSWTFGSSRWVSVASGNYVDIWWKYYAPPNSYLDTKQSNDGNFGGWAYDPSSSASIAVHVYVDGPAGSGAPGYAITADGSRPDVNSAFGITGNHGFNFTLPSPYLQDGRNHTLYFYAISLFNQPNPFIGNGTYFAPYVEPTCGAGLVSCCGDGTMCRTSCSGVHCY